MFELETAIAEWRRQMLAAGIKSPVPLDELESHLRDEVEQQMRLGLGEPEAFKAAVGLVGRANALQGEFGKVDSTNDWKPMMKNIAIFVALFGSVLGGSLALPALGNWHRTGVLRMWPIAAGVTLAVAAGCAAVYGIRSSREARGRGLVSLGIIVAGIFYTVPLIQAFFIARTGPVDWVVCGFLALASVLFYGACFKIHRRLPIS